ncbi:putative hydrolase [Brevibacterium sanguinis]|uniref:Hydrolase n=2 Tax=Brevibacterium TaxID=1696 RepID=A0ABX9GVA7_9MICO|nr:MULTISPECIES: zinc-dependent metalloprotease [Brevibacterium]RBP66316.1 putative hydrolase [Brevibacterium sanguinis]RBP72967.1 putative hydrolase [Brevibacterium celere]
MSDENNNEQNPFEQIFGMLFGAGGPGAGQSGDKDDSKGTGGFPQGFSIDPAMMATIMNQMQGLFGQGADSSAQAKSIALRSVPSPDPAVPEASVRATTDAFRLAELWLAEATEFSVANRSTRSLTRADWVSTTMPGWQRFVLPIKENMSTALTETLETQVPAEMKSIMAGASTMFSSMSDSMFAMQIGQAVGALSESVLTGTEVGLPLLPHDTAVLVETNVERFAADIDVDVTEVRIYLAAQELAHLALFERAPWLSAQVETALTRYAQGLKVDTTQIEEMASSIDPSNISDLSENIRQGLFNPPTTDEQKRALTTLENLLAVIAGWVDVVVHSACAHLPGRDQIREALRRRRATAGPAEKTFSTLVGLQLNPRRLRDAAALFAYLESQGGTDARDRVFSHPDLLPTTEDLDDPLGYSDRRHAEWTSESTLDEALTRILAEGLEGTERTDEDTERLTGTDSAGEDGKSAPGTGSAEEDGNAGPDTDGSGTDDKRD